MLVYLIFDIDCLDFVFVSGIGMLVIGGLIFDCVIKLVCGLKDFNIVGMDVVEVVLVYDQLEIIVLVVVMLVLEMLYIQVVKKGE